LPASLSQSQEDYLEAILGIAKDGADVTVSDIARQMGVAKPSVTGAMQRLENMGLVRHGRYDYVELTPAGKRRARGIAGRHELLRNFLIDVLEVGRGTADKDACAIEHHASRETIRALVRFMQHAAGNNPVKGGKAAR